MPVATTNLALYLPLVVDLCLLIGIGLILFVPFFPGLAVMLAGVLLYVGYQSTLAHTFAGMDPVWFGLILVLALAGLTSGWWSEKLGLRFTYMSQQVMWGAIMGSFIGLFFGTFGMLLGFIVGAMAMELRGGRSFPESLRQGVASLMSMLGPRGFQLLMALVVGNLVLSHL